MAKLGSRNDIVSMMTHLWDGRYSAQVWIANRPGEPLATGSRRWYTIYQVIGFYVRSCLSGWPIYCLAFVTFQIVIGLVYGIRWSANGFGPYVLARPFIAPTQVIVAACSCYVLFAAALWRKPSSRSVRDDREHVGVAISAQVIGRFLAGILLYGLLLLLLVPPSIMLTRASNLVAPANLTLSLAPTFLSAALAVTIGLFIGVAVRSRATAATVAAVVVAIAHFVQWGHLLLASAPVAAPYQALLPLVDNGQQLLSFLSPFGAADGMLDAAWRSDHAALLGLELATAISAALWLMATWLLLMRRRKSS